MNKNISTIGYEIPGNSDSIIDFSSKTSLMDTDIILITPELPYYERSSVGNGIYLGKTCYGETGSFQLKEDFEHWGKELSNAFRTGKTVFLMLASKNDFYLDTGGRSYSGSGRNRNTTINVATSNNYEFLPNTIGTIHSAKGKEIIPAGNPLFNDLFNTLGPDFEYQIYLENIEGTPVFVGKDKSKILGAIFKIGSGNLVALPYLRYDEDKFVEYKKDKKGEEKGFWTKDAIKFGNIFVSCLIDIDSGLKKETIKTPPPAWALSKKFSSKKELEIEVDINNNIKEIKRLENKNRLLGIELQKENAIRDLLYEQGKPLENSVIEALITLGYKAENFNNGELELDQVITSPEGIRYIGECEGKNEKDIDITKFRQLLESLSADFARDEITDKAFGILFGNAQRLTDPKDRKLDFTQKCQTGATREKIALVKTHDLFVVVKFLKENNNQEYKMQCRRAIFDGLGKIIIFPPIPKEKQNEK